MLSEHQRRYRISVVLANFRPDAILPLRAQQNKLTAHKARPTPDTSTVISAFRRALSSINSTSKITLRLRESVVREWLAPDDGKMKTVEQSLPPIANCPRAAISGRVRCKLAVELAEQRDAVG